jgi:hypothetical protein
MGSREKSHSIYYGNKEQEHINLEDFELVSVIGRGNFGKVNTIFILKSMYIGVFSIFTKY